VPRVAGERLVHLGLRGRLDREHDALLVRERAAEDNKAGVDEAVHERGVRVPVDLLLERTRRVPLRAVAAEDDKEHAASLAEAAGSMLSDFR